MLVLLFPSWTCDNDGMKKTGRQPESGITDTAHERRQNVLLYSQSCSSVKPRIHTHVEVGTSQQKTKRSSKVKNLRWISNKVPSELGDFCSDGVGILSQIRITETTYNGT